MTPNERALLLAVAKMTYSNPRPFTVQKVQDLITAVEAEDIARDVGLPGNDAMSCETCRYWPDMPHAAPCHLCVEFSMWKPRHPDRDDDISRVYEEAKAVITAAAYDPEPMSETCPVCKGTGMTVFNACQDMCGVCDGTGRKK